MKGLKIFFVVLMATLSVNLSACGLIPIEKQGLLTGEKPIAVDVESYTYYEELLIIDAGEGKVNIRINTASSVVTSDFSKKVVDAVKEKFTAALKERGIIVHPDAPIKIRVGMARGKKDIVVLFCEMAEFFKEGNFVYKTSVVGGYPDPAGGFFEPDGWRNLGSIRNSAGKIAEVLANATVSIFREKGEIKSEKK